MWFRIEVECNLFAGFAIYDFGAEANGNKIGYEVPEISNKISQETAKFIDSDIFMDCQNWWLTYCYPNGKIEECDYDDVPNFKGMNSCAVSLVDKDKREEYVKRALLKFEEMLLRHLK